MVLTAQGIVKHYMRKSGDANFFCAVAPANMELRPGTITAIMGRSGSGKTTLLNMLAGLLKPTEGRVLLDGKDIYALSDGELSRLRNKHIGVVPQGRSALDSLTVLENVLLPGALYGGAHRPETAAVWLERFGIAGLADARPAQLSGGELRRVALARALASDCEIILADEPTGDLDDENTALVLQTLRKTADDGRAVLLVTHEDDALAYADIAYRMNAGALESIDVHPHSAAQK